MPRDIGDRVPLLALAFLAFVGLGLPDPLPGTLWPELRPHYAQPHGALGLVLAAMATGYLTASILAGRAMQALGIGALLAASIAATAAAALGQAFAPPWLAFVALAMLAGFGSGAVDAALNTFAALRFAPRHLNWLHACWGSAPRWGRGWRRRCSRSAPAGRQAMRRWAWCWRCWRLPSPPRAHAGRTAPARMHRRCRRCRRCGSRWCGG